MPELLPDFEVFRSKPAAYALLLQVGMQAGSEIPVLAGIADETGVVLGGMALERMDIGNRGIRQTCPTQKGFGKISLRPFDSIRSKGRRTTMLHRLQALHRTQVEVGEDRPFDSGVAEVGSDEVGFAEVGSAEVGSSEVGSSEVGSSEVSSAEVGSVEVGSVEVGSPEVGSAEVGSVEAGSAAGGNDEAGKAEEVEVGVAEVGFLEVGFLEVGSAEIGSAEIGSAEVGSAEVGSAEVRPETWALLFLPWVPDRCSFPEKIKMLLVRHRMHLLCCALIIKADRPMGKHASSCERNAQRRGRSKTRLLDTTPFAWFLVERKDTASEVAARADGLSGDARLVLFCSFLWRFPGLQITQQACQGFLVVVVLLPISKVGDVSGALQMGGPTGRAPRNRAIQAKGKQHRRLSLVLLGDGRFHLEFDPCTHHRVLREDQQQLVIEANGLIDTLPDLVAGLHVFRCEPTAHAFTLQVGIEPLGKATVSVGIADKAGVVLDRALHKRPRIFDEGVGESSPTQEGFWNVALRPHDGIGPNCRRSCMAQCLQSLHCPQINISEDGPSYLGSPEVGIVEIGFSEVGSAQVGSAQVGFSEVGSVEVGSIEVGSAQVGSIEVGIVEVSSAEVSFSEVGKAEVGSAEVGFSEIGKAEAGFAQVGSAEAGSAQVGIVEVGSVEVGSAQVSFAQVRLEEWTLLCHPCIPGRYPLPKTIKVLLICHIAFLLCSALIIGTHKLMRKHLAFSSHGRQNQ
jgi:hypothetical protein